MCVPPHPLLSFSFSVSVVSLAGFLKMRNRSLNVLDRGQNCFLSQPDAVAIDSKKVNVCLKSARQLHHPARWCLSVEKSRKKSLVAVCPKASADGEPNVIFQPHQVAFPLGLLLTTPSPCQRRAVARPTFTGPLGASAAKRNLLLPPWTSLSRKTTRMFFASRCGECSFVSGSDSDTISSEPCLHLCKGNKDEKQKVHAAHHQESMVVSGSVTEKDFGM
ncbi:uncharacterized protein LOC125103955 [Lutra lutra]|uniref:uncharacterized protein LOC125103955 n=1 Tax=Lutra lutra TaxID=9657 RepID=UPI001FD14A56|nr:uncharacterized protein LOC125103955 [Lutra lutra]